VLSWAAFVGGVIPLSHVWLPVAECAPLLPAYLAQVSGHHDRCQLHEACSVRERIGMFQAEQPMNRARDLCAKVLRGGWVSLANVPADNSDLWCIVVSVPGFAFVGLLVC
jgi:hypothetical protein